MGLFVVVGLLYEIGKGLGFSPHPIPDFFGCERGFGGLLLQNLPLGGGHGDLVAHRLHVFDFFDDCGKRGGFRHLKGRAIFSEKGRHAEPGARGHTSHHAEQRRGSERFRTFMDDPGGQKQQQHIAQIKRPLGYFRRNGFSHEAMI